MTDAFDFSRRPDADELIDQALTLPAEARLQFVRQAVGHDPALLAALESIIREATRDDGFLDPGGALSGALGREIGQILDDEADAPLELSPGDRIEHYEIVDFIGRGGMGVVYRARDLRLGRDVAVKILPDRFARDPERVARFRREARALAALSHTGIGAIHGVAEREGLEALVLELVEGPTLAERLERGALPMEEALSIGRRLAEAIAAAHARGILHRDLKPANIKVLLDGGVKVLDFGLARMLYPDAAGDAATDLSAQSPGMILGTAAYMSPEQARGQTVDERADIWAFGCILFEMLTGARAFAGATVADVLARVMEREPAFGLLPSATPEPIRRLLRRTLEKNPQRRLGHIGDAILEFDDAATPSLAPVEPASARWKSWLLVAAGVAAGAIGTALVLRQPAPATPVAVARFVVPLPTGDQPVTGFQPMAALSPDGRTIVYRARRNGVVQLFRRHLHALEPEPIPGTENGTAPFFSPDGRTLAFDSDGVLKRVSMAGGQPVVIGPAPGGVTATWTSDDAVVFATNTSRILQRMPASGGAPVALTALDPERGDTLHLLPQALPDGRTLLFTIVSGSARRVALRLASGEVRVVADGTHGRYLPQGFIVFFREGSLWAVPFDLASLSTTGPASPLLQGIEHTDNTVLHFDAAQDGSIVYLPAGEVGASQQRLVWFDRDGRETAVALEPRSYLRVSLSPDGARLALAIRERGNTDIWTADLERGTIGRLTFDPTIETMPTWSPDGRTIAFRSEREGPGLFRRDAQGASAIERLTATDGPIHSPYSWTPDGKTLLFALFRSFRNQAIASVTPPDRTIRVLLDGDFAQLDPQVSRDGRWLAYQSDESDRFEIYVRPYPNVEAGRWQISTTGGTSPRWSPDGRELYYVDQTGLVSVPVEPGAAFKAGRPHRLFAVKAFGGRLGADYEVAPDNSRFLFILDEPSTTARAVELVYVQHWVEELKQRVAAGR
jgi:eukaryotic-like serine/threonine-protein kinase